MSFHNSSYRYVLVLLGFLLLNPVNAESLEVKLAYIGASDSSAYAGVHQGLDEANIQGHFLGQNYHVDQVTWKQASEGDLSHNSAILASLSTAELMQLAATYPGIPVLNLSDEADSLRSACVQNLFHVISSQRMQADALAQWQIKHPGSGAHAQAWHYSMRKFAAAQLNSRFNKAQGRPMDDTAWAGWAAVRLLADVVAHNQTAKAGELLQLMKEDLAFDGQKGINMSFRKTGQLRQPLLIIENDKIAGMAPVRGVAKATQLDTLGSVNCGSGS